MDNGSLVYELDQIYSVLLSRVYEAVLVFVLWDLLERE